MPDPTKTPSAPSCMTREASAGLAPSALTHVADPPYGDGRAGARLNDPHDPGRVGHAGDAALPPDVGRNPFQCHDGDGPGLLGDAGLIRRGDVHDDAALQHLGQAALDPVSSVLDHAWSPQVGTARTPILPPHPAGLPPWRFAGLTPPLARVAAHD